jgi:hypothetical protein
MRTPFPAFVAMVAGGSEGFVDFSPETGNPLFKHYLRFFKSRVGGRQRAFTALSLDFRGG